MVLPHHFNPSLFSFIEVLHVSLKMSEEGDEILPTVSF